MISVLNIIWETTAFRISFQQLLVSLGAIYFSICLQNSQPSPQTHPWCHILLKATPKLSSPREWCPLSSLCTEQTSITTPQSEPQPLASKFPGAGPEPWLFCTHSTHPDACHNAARINVELLLATPSGPEVFRHQKCSYCKEVYLDPSGVYVGTL